MVFSSMLFLWIFLPAVLTIYYIAKDEYRNYLLLISSLLFYAWGEPKYIFVMLAIITVNYLLGLWMSYVGNKRILLVLAIVADLSFLFYFKYFNLFSGTINRIMAKEIIALRDIVLPIGISFYIFQAMSYIVDLYRGQIQVQRNWCNLSLYISFFPQLIAGPIVRYKDICKQIDNRVCSVDKFSYGVKRFVFGLGKKVIIANTMAAVVDDILSIPVEIGTGLSWCVALCYTFQIYFDFSGYSDMAIGLGKMFGFDILENFSHPYISQSIQEFWQRWHISLSTWFKEYLYIPLGGNRRGTLRTCMNLLAVFLATGLWHGANYTFVIWGLYHGFFSIVERFFLGKILKENKFKLLNHLYTSVIFVVGWVIFRADSLGQALALISNMFFYKADIGYGIGYFMGMKETIIFVLALFLSVVAPYIKMDPAVKAEGREISWYELLLCVVIMAYSILLMVTDTYNPFIYFRF